MRNKFNYKKIIYMVLLILVACTIIFSLSKIGSFQRIHNQYSSEQERYESALLVQKKLDNYTDEDIEEMAVEKAHENGFLAENEKIFYIIN